MKLSDITRPFGRANQDDNSNDLGFGTSIGTEGERLINRDGSYNIVRKGGVGWRPYELLVEMPWINFLGLIALFYFIINAFFALVFWGIGIDKLSGVNPGDGFFEHFVTAFFFSIQTFTTVGYGAVSPLGIWANLIASIDALVGLMSFALATGILFARFAKPKANILFSTNALIRPYRDTPYNSLQFQIVNQRNNKIINLEARVALTWAEKANGDLTRRFAIMELEREKVALFPLNWVVVHVIDKDSPMWGWDKADFEQKQVEIIILMRGYDETFAQDVHANSSYTYDEIKWNMRFQRIYHSSGGRTIIELDKVNDMLPMREEEE